MTAAAHAQTTANVPVTEQVTVNVFGPWTHGFETTDKADTWVREHPAIYIKAAATEIADKMDGKAVSWSLVSVDFKTNTGYSNFPFRARAKVEVTLGPWSMNISKEVAKDEAIAEASGEKPIENELDQRIAELEALDEETSDVVVDKLTSDLLSKINDIDVMQDTLVSVLARLTSKGPAMGLWSGGKTAHRYISRLEEMAARVQQVKDSVTGLQDHAWGKTASLIDGLLDELGALETGVGLSVHRTPDATYAFDPDRIAFWDARDGLRQSLVDARIQTTFYDLGMNAERHARSARAWKREETRKKLKDDAIRAAEAGDEGGAEPSDDGGLDLRAALTKGNDKKALKAALTPVEGSEGENAEPAQSLKRKEKKRSPLRTTARSDTVSPIRREAGADDGPRTMDAEGSGTQAGPEKESAPRVETPRVTSPFDLAREEKQRLAQQQEAKEASIRFNERTRLVIDQRISEEQAGNQELFVAIGSEQESPEYPTWRTCQDLDNAESRRAFGEFKESCPDPDGSTFRDKYRYSNLRGLYEWLREYGCAGDFTVKHATYGDPYPKEAADRGAPDYDEWHEKTTAKNLRRR